MTTVRWARSAGQDGAGSVGIELPPASSTGDPADQTHARIWLLQGNLLSDIGDAEGELFKQVEIESSDNEVSVGPVLAGAGYQVILSIGELEENLIGSNCGQYIRRHLSAKKNIENGYTYEVQPLG